MTNKTDKNKLKLLETQQAEDRARLTALLTQANTPKPVETGLEKEQLDWMNATTGKAGPLDITSLSAMKPYLNLYDTASQRQQGERMGIGALQLGAQGQNPMLGQLLREQLANERQQAAAGGLENAYRLTDAQMRGNIFPLLGLQQNRNMGLAGLGAGLSQNSTAQYANFRPPPSFLQNLILGGIGAAGNVFSKTL